MRLNVNFAYKLGLGGVEPHVVAVRDLDQARRAICKTVEAYKEELGLLLEASPVSVLPEVNKAYVEIVFGPYVEGEDNPIINETKRRVAEALQPFECQTGSNGSS